MKGWAEIPSQIPSLKKINQITFKTDTDSVDNAKETKTYVENVLQDTKLNYPSLVSIVLLRNKL